MIESINIMQTNVEQCGGPYSETIERAPGSEDHRIARVFRRPAELVSTAVRIEGLHDRSMREVRGSKWGLLGSSSKKLGRTVRWRKT